MMVAIIMMQIKYFTMKTIYIAGSLGILFLIVEFTIFFSV